MHQAVTNLTLFSPVHAFQRKDNARATEEQDKQLNQPI